MEIKFKIVEVYPADQTIVVRFWSDVTPLESLVSQTDADGNPVRYRSDIAITLPVPNPTGDDLTSYISARCPKQFFEIKAAVADTTVDTSMSAILELVNTELAVTTTATTATTDTTASTDTAATTDEASTVDASATTATSS